MAGRAVHQRPRRGCADLRCEGGGCEMDMAGQAMGQRAQQQAAKVHSPSEPGLQSCTGSTGDEVWGQNCCSMGFPPPTLLRCHPSLQAQRG